jgi:hypothetical protein
MAHTHSFFAPFAWYQRQSRRIVGRHEPASRSPDARFDSALDLLGQGRAGDAFVVLGALANDGHGPAARIALLLAQRGGLLFGGTYVASSSERRRWQRLAG